MTENKLTSIISSRINDQLRDNKIQQPKRKLEEVANLRIKTDEFIAKQ